MTTRIETRFTREYGIEHPIAQAAMAFVGTPPGLCIAVCQAGGLGSLAVGPLPADVISGLVRAVKEATDCPFNVNFINVFVNEAQIQACIDEHVPIVSFHWGHPPKDVIDRLHDADIKVWEQVGSVDTALQAAEAGVDLIIAQGSEAGGHNFGRLPTFVLVPAIREVVGAVPVLAAGGIATGRQVAAALLLGADGVWIGTRFVASEEAFAHARYKEDLLAATDTRLSHVFGPDRPQFNPIRVLDAGLAYQYADRENSAPKDLASQPVIATMKLAGEQIPLRRFSSFLPTPDTEGNIEELPLAAGQGVGLIHDMPPVSHIIQTMMEDAEAALASVRLQSQERFAG